MSPARPFLSRETLSALSDVRSRAQLSGGLRRIAAEIGAERYLLMATTRVQGAEHPCVIASNWVWDAIASVGLVELDRLAGGELSTAVGQTPVIVVPGGEPPLPPAAARALGEAGQAEFCFLRVGTGMRRCRAIFSASEPGSLVGARLPAAQLACCHLVSRMDARLLGELPADALSDRERECLHWVAEGKTTDEVALIVGVTANTVNSYIANAIQKFGAANRAMAIAAAIRSGAI